MSTESWIKTKLGTVVSTSSGGTPSRSEPSYYSQGTIPWIRSGELEDNIITSSELKITKKGLLSSNAKILPAGTLLIAMYGATIGKMAFLGIAAATNQAVCSLAPQKGLLAHFLYYFLLYQRPNLIKKGIGGAQANISQTILRNLDITIPPLEIQERIVGKIEELFSDIEHGLETLKQIKEKLAAYRQAVMKSAFDSQTNNIKKIKELCSVRVGIVIKPAQYYTDKKTGIRAFRSANVKEFGVQDSDWVYLNKEGHQANKKSELQQGDILIVRSGYPGTSCVVPPEYAGSNAIDILIARPDISKIIPEYLCLFTNSPHGKKLVTKHKRGVAQAHLNVGEYSNLCIPVPSLKEQYEICSKIGEKLTMCDTIDLAINRAILQTSTLKQSILKKAFEGDLI